MEVLSTEDAPVSIGPFFQGVRDGDAAYVVKLPVDIEVEIEAVASLR